MPSHTQKTVSWLLLGVLCKLSRGQPHLFYMFPSSPFPIPGLVQIDMNGKPFISNIGLIYPLFRESKYCNFSVSLFLLHFI